MNINLRYFEKKINMIYLMWIYLYFVILEIKSKIIILIILYEYFLFIDMVRKINEIPLDIKGLVINDEVK